VIEVVIPAFTFLVSEFDDLHLTPQMMRMLKIIFKFIFAKLNYNI